MSKKTNGVNFSRTIATISRRKRALARLEAQLESGTKTQKKSTQKISLSKEDEKRIKKEIEILKSKI